MAETPYCTHDGQITHMPARTGEELRFVRDHLDEKGIIVQVYGPRGGLHGTIRLPLLAVQGGLHLAEMWHEHEKAGERLAEMDRISPRCAWDKYNVQCTHEERLARVRYRKLLAQQEAYEVRAGC